MKTRGQEIAHDAIHEGMTEYELADAIDKAIAESAKQPVAIMIDELMVFIEAAIKNYANYKKHYPTGEHYFMLSGFELNDWLEILKNYAVRAAKPPEPASGEQFLIGQIISEIDDAADGKIPGEKLEQSAKWILELIRSHPLNAQPEPASGEGVIEQLQAIAQKEPGHHEAYIRGIGRCIAILRSQTPVAVGKVAKADLPPYLRYGAKGGHPEVHFAPWENANPNNDKPDHPVGLSVEMGALALENDTRYSPITMEVFRQIDKYQDRLGNVRAIFEALGLKDE